MNWYWGDLHCHTNLSYGRGTMARAMEIARTHLDFCTVTGHAFWPDMPTDLGQFDDTITMHLAGFAKCRKYWPDCQQILRQYDSAGLVTFPSYEWHSDRYGDYNVYGKNIDLPLVEATSVNDFENHFTPGEHLIVPHHIGYTQGHRGIDWDTFVESRLTSLVEVYSNHGCAMSDESPFDYYHSMGPRDGRRTVEAGLKRGLKFGLIASTDSHDGFPGHYSHGRVGVLAESKTREAIWLALMSRRTVAGTGARIVPDFQINGAGIGESIRAAGDRDVRLRLEGNQPFRFVEIARNGQVIQRPAAAPLDQEDPRGIYYVKLEWGWGLKEQVCQWEHDLRITGGELLAVEPCFRHAALDKSDEPPHRITHQSESRVGWMSRTRGVPETFLHNPQTMTSGVSALVLKIQANDQTTLSLKNNWLEMNATWPELRGGSVVKHAGGHDTPAVRLKRPYAAAACTIETRFSDAPQKHNDEDFYYVSATQIDNESIWLTPIWVSK